MSEFMLTVFFGVVFCFSIMMMLEGLLFLNRVLLIIWFDFDFVEKNREWVRNARESVHKVIARLKEKSEIKKKKEEDNAKTLLIIERDEDVSEQE